MSEKAQIALEALKGNMTLNEITKKYGGTCDTNDQMEKSVKKRDPRIFLDCPEKDEPF